MDCICGKKMKLIGTAISADYLQSPLKIWACPPNGCGRIYLESSGFEVKGTYYLPEKNNMRGGINES